MKKFPLRFFQKTQTYFYIIGILLVYSGIGIAKDFTVRVVFIGGGIAVILARLLYTACTKHVIRCPYCKTIFSVIQKKGHCTCPVCSAPILLDVHGE